MNAGTPTVIVPRRAPNPLTAGGWSGLSFVAANILNTLIYFPLARRLGPEDFGLYAQANLLYGALTLLAEGSVIRTLVQMRGERATLSRGGLWLSAALGLAGLVICAAAAPLMVRLYNNPDVRPLLLWLAPSVLIAALGATPHALLQRELDFRRKTLPETLAIGAGGMAALGAAFAGLGAYSLVALTMTAASVSTVTAWWVCRERPTPAPPGWPLLRRMARFTGSLGAADLALYLRLNTDYALTGRILGAAPLGIYTVAWATSAGPLLFITAFTGRVGFAVYARLQGEGERLREVFLSALRIVATAAVPVFLGAVVIAPDLVPVALGSRWEAAAGPVVPLFLLQMVRTVCGPGASLILATGRSRLYLIIGVAVLPLTVAAVLVGTRAGVLGVAGGMLIAVGTASLVYLVTAARLLRLGPGDLASVLVRPALITAAALPVMVAAQAALSGPAAPAAARLVVVTALGVATALLMLRRLWPRVQADLTRLRDALPEDGEPQS